MITSRLPSILAAVAAAAGVAAWIVFVQHDLVLSHYDAKAHLVVARRAIDSLTPGWKQIGAVWLPLPHLLQLLPTQIDVFYRTGAFASATSIACFALTVWAAARLTLLMTGSSLGAVTTAALLILNPNLLYLQSTPMTEPLLFAVTFVAILWLYEWSGTAAAVPDEPPRKIGWILFAAAWTRYEAWLVIAAALTIVVAARGIRSGLRLAVWPAAAAAIFLLDSRLTTGQWLVTAGFYEIDPTYHGLPIKALIAVWWGTHRLGGYVVETVALSTVAWLAIRVIRGKADRRALLPLALFATAALPFYAFVEGHPFRVRYMAPLAAACALWSGIAVGTMRRRAAVVLAVMLVSATLIESPPWSGRAPMIEEAQWDKPRTIERRALTACLAPQYHGEKIMASMGSLAHYMQELSNEGLTIADFLHEGNGSIWELALESGPAPHAGWMLVEEQSEGGDVLARKVRENPAFTRGMVRVCEGGGVALYRRVGR